MLVLVKKLPYSLDNYLRMLYTSGMNNLRDYAIFFNRPEVPYQGVPSVTTTTFTVNIETRKQGAIGVWSWRQMQVQATSYANARDVAREQCYAQGLEVRVAWTEGDPELSGHKAIY